MQKRQALRSLPEYDPDNDIGAVDRVRFCVIHKRMDQLRPAELTQMARWEKIDAWCRDRYYDTGNKDKWGDKELLPVHSHRALRQLVMTVFSVSWDTAERDIRNTKKFHAEVLDDQEYYRSVYIEDAERRAEEACRSGKYAAGERFMRLAAELRGLYDEKQEEFVYEKLESIQFIIEYNPEAVGLKTVENKDELFAKWRQQRRSISEVMNEEANDVDVE